MQIQKTSEKTSAKNEPEPLPCHEHQQPEIKIKPSVSEFGFNHTCGSCPMFCKASRENSKKTWLYSSGICFLVLSLMCTLIFWIIIRNDSIGELIHNIMCIK